jgi:integrase
MNTMIAPTHEASTVFADDVSVAESLILKAKAQNTTSSYLRELENFRDWANDRKVDWFPPTVTVLTGFVGFFLSKTGVSRARILLFRAAINWAHKVSGLSLIQSNLFSLAVEGAVRSCELPKQTTPFPRSYLVRCLQQLALEDNLLSLRLGTLLVFLFHGFLRISEALALRTSDVFQHGTYIELKIRSSKTDQTGKGASVIIAKGTGPVSPGSIVSRYLHKLGASTDPSNPFFPRFRGTKRLDTPLTYDCARKNFLFVLKSCNITEHFSFHSLRAGGTTTAANAGVADSLLMHHGRWRNGQTMASRYINPSVQRQLQVSEATI